jgi:hypothetical protein
MKDGLRDDATVTLQRLFVLSGFASACKSVPLRSAGGAAAPIPRYTIAWYRTTFAKSL